MNNVDVLLLRREIGDGGSDAFQIGAAKTAEIRPDGIFLTARRTAKREFAARHRDKIALISLQNFQIAHNERRVERYRAKSAQPLARMVAVNQFNPNFRYRHLILTGQKSSRRPSFYPLQTDAE